MAFYLEKEKTFSTPYIIIDEKKGYMKMEGQCFHENVVVLFKEINDWLDIYLKTDFGLFTFDCDIEYLNSSTLKLLNVLLLKLDKHSCENNKIIVNWITIEEDDIMIECGEDYQEEMESLKFNLLTK
ncbi:MAG: DUF1987 domain-containing protein [Treponema sp.]|nr:DUF1987 domain-containing protein [Treponema sp.]